jgi:hypothetical protein
VKLVNVCVVVAKRTPAQLRLLGWRVAKQKVGNKGLKAFTFVVKLLGAVPFLVDINSQKNFQLDDFLYGCIFLISKNRKSRFLRSLSQLF